jgi:Ni,Fe-hydrogenase III small subunit
MISFIFVSVVCIGMNCDFMTSTQSMTQEKCQKMRKQFEALPFRPEVTLATSQCMEFKKEMQV